MLHRDGERASRVYKRALNKIAATKGTCRIRFFFLLQPSLLLTRQANKPCAMTGPDMWMLATQKVKNNSYLEVDDDSDV